jgi:hypothetical protein
MRYDDTPSAFGLFRLAYEDLVAHLGAANFELRQTREPGLPRQRVNVEQVSDQRMQLSRELNQFDQSSAVQESLARTREACKIIADLERWRNEPIHPYAEITLEQIERNINLANRAKLHLRFHVPELISQLNWKQELERLLGPLLVSN